MFTKSIYVDIDIELSDLSASDIAEWLNNATQHQLDELSHMTTSVESDTLMSLCRELDCFGVESFLNAFADEIGKIDSNVCIVIRQRIADYLK